MKGGDLFAGLFEQRIAAAEQNLAQLNEILAVIGKAFELLSQVSYDADAKPPGVQFVKLGGDRPFGGGTGTSW